MNQTIDDQLQIADARKVECRDNRRKIPEKAKQTLKQAGKGYGSTRELKRLREWFALYF